MKRVLLVLALLGFAWWLDCSEAAQAQKPVESFPGQAYHDATGWHLED